MGAVDSQTRQLKFVIVGHVDHGKSTLIGRLLYDTDSLPPSKMEEIRTASAELGHDVEFSYVMDNLQEERSQRVTIDTAQIQFRTPQSEYVIIDAPGHRQFIRNMVTGASEAEAAVFIVDAEEGVREQTRRHAYVLAMLGIEQVIVVINKMDLVGWSQERFQQVSGELTSFLGQLGITPLLVIPASAKLGDNVAKPSTNMPWCTGAILIDSLAQLRRRGGPQQLPLRLPIQDRYELDGKKILLGRIDTGTIRTGQEVLFLPSGVKAEVASIEVFLQDRTSAEADESIGVTLRGDEPIGRGEVACPTDAPAAVSGRFRASVFWLSNDAFRMGEQLKLRCATQQVPCTIERIERLTDSSTLELIAQDARQMAATQVGHVVIRTERPIAVEPFAQTPELGRFVLTRGHDAAAGGIITETKG
ncbi:MAG: GTP-binding protein [Phycisphaerae bacterium]|nr:GTP-binding protein [Phycisphaerae bacterium]